MVGIRSVRLSFRLISGLWCCGRHPAAAGCPWPTIEPHRDHLNAQLNDRVIVATTIHQRLAAEHDGLDASVASLRCWPKTARRAQVTVLRDAPSTSPLEVD